MAEFDLDRRKRRQAGDVAGQPSRAGGGTAASYFAGHATISLVLEMYFTPLTRPSVYFDQSPLTSTGVGPAAAGRRRLGPPRPLRRTRVGALPRESEQTGLGPAGAVRDPEARITPPPDQPHRAGGDRFDLLPARHRAAPRDRSTSSRGAVAAASAAGFSPQAASERQASAPTATKTLRSMRILPFPGGLVLVDSRAAAAPHGGVCADGSVWRAFLARRTLANSRGGL